MGQQIIKTAPDRDQYLLWSSITDSWLLLGTRTEMLEELPKPKWKGWDQESAERALARADEHGSSAYRPFGCTWDDDYLTVMEGAPRDGWYHLARDRIPAYADAIDRGDEAAATALLECWQRHGEDDD